MTTPTPAAVAAADQELEPAPECECCKPLKRELLAVRAVFAEASHNAGPAFVAHEELARLRSENARLLTSHADELASVRAERDEAVDAFIDALFEQLKRLGIDTGDCDGDDPPEAVIADWINGLVLEDHAASNGLIDSLRAEVARLTAEREELMIADMKNLANVGIANETVKRVTAERDAAQARLEQCQSEAAAMRTALEEIAQGSGAFSRDPLKHAENCINNAIGLATAALSSTAGSDLLAELRALRAKEQPAEAVRGGNHKMRSEP